MEALILGLIGNVVFLFIAFWSIGFMFQRFNISKENLAWKSLVWLINRSKTNDSARFMNRREELQVFGPRNKGLIIDGRSQRLSEDASCKHIAILARTGAGKTSRFILPNLLKQDQCSFLVTDLSGELFQKTSGYLKKRGFQVKALNLMDFSQSMQYNPLAFANSFTEIQQLSHVLVKSSNPNDKDPFWGQGAEKLLSILITCLKNGPEEYQNLANVKHLLNHFGSDGRNLESFISQYADETTFSEYQGFVSGNEKTIQSFVVTAQTALRMLGNPEIGELTARNDLDFNQLRNEKTALFLMVSQEQMEFYSFLINIFYTQFFAACFSSLQPKLPTYCLLDEFGHLFIPNFDTVVSTIRKYRVSVSIVLQNEAQLRQRYSEAGAKTILEGGMASKLYFSGMDINTAKQLEQTLGKVKLNTQNNKLFGEQYNQEKNLMNADQIRTLKDDEAIFLHENQKPAKITMLPYFKQGDLVRKTKIAPVINNPRNRIPVSLIPISP